jgi:nucleoside-diphosphate kinase
MLKPDAIQRGLAGKIIARFERKGFKLVAAKLMNVSRELARKHYEEHKGKAFFEPTVDYITSSPVMAMVWEGDNIVAMSRTLMGATNPVQADPGSIRGSLAADVSRNLIHGSDSPENAEREIGLYFSPDEILCYVKAGQQWLSEGK